MNKSKANLHNKIFWILIILAIIIGYIVYGLMQDHFSTKFLVLFSGLPFLLFVTGFFGLLWPKIKLEGNEVYIYHAMIIGILFIVLFYIHVWILLPHICPNFGECLGV